MSQPVPQRASAGRQLKAAALLVLLLAGVLGVAYGVYYVTVGRPLLSGEHDHDFGIVEVAGPGRAVSVSHTFVLRNRTGKPVTIQDIKTSCSCSVASLSTGTVEPGGTVEIEAQLSMNQDGRKRAKVFLNCGADGVEVLRMEAMARNRQRLMVPAKFAILEVGRPVHRAFLYFDYDTNDQPPDPVITAPEGVTTEVTAWTMTRRRRPVEGLPAHWKADVKIEQTASSVPVPGEIVIRVGEDQQASIALVKEAPPPLPEGARATLPVPLGNPKESPPADR